MAISLSQFAILALHGTGKDFSNGVSPFRPAHLANNVLYAVFLVVGALAVVTGFRGAFVLIDLTFMTGIRNVPNGLPDIHIFRHGRP